MSVRVRFAPSPTGYLHVGGLRTALYNHLFARHHGGVTVLRIEDTDRTRYVEGSVENIISMMRWAGIEFDEGPVQGGNYGPYTQSERFDLYRKYAAELIANDTAYYAFDTSEELDAMRERQQKAKIAPRYDRTVMRNQYTLGADETQRLIEAGEPYTIRLKVPFMEEVRCSDLVRGEIIVHTRDVDDQILLKSDGFPTYHLANIVDDKLMAITHVIRGEEWLPSLPKHILLYRAFGWEPPQFAHLPLLLNPDKTKLSKRQGDVAVEDYRNKGYLPDALVNFVALLGWNPSAEREIYKIEEMIASFSIEKVNKAGAVFDLQKLNWMQSEYLKAKDPLELAEEAMPIVEQAGFTAEKQYVADVLSLIRERITFVNEILPFADYMFTEPTVFDEEYKQKCWTAEAGTALQVLAEKLSADIDWNLDVVKGLVKETCTQTGIKMGALMNPLRLVLTGKSVGAGVIETAILLGKERTIRRIHTFLSGNNAV
jgi:glutamyl-tRNA synthetase